VGGLLGGLKFFIRIRKKKVPLDLKGGISCRFPYIARLRAPKTAKAFSRTLLAPDPHFTGEI